MSLLTPTEVQALGVGLALSAAELQTIIDREEAEIVRRFGANYADAPITESAMGGGPSLYLRRAIEAITSLTETAYLGGTPATLTTADYYVWGGEGRITRLPEYMRWGRLVTVTYTPTDDTELRRMVLAELVRIATEQTTPSSAQVGGLSFSIGSGAGDATGAGWAQQRAVQYARLGFLSR